MSINHSTTSVLILSHCVPDGAGTGDRQRAWRLLSHIRHSHRVCLACVWDGPVHWHQWRPMHALSDQLTIERPDLTRRVTAAVVRRFSTEAGDRARLQDCLVSASRLWARRYSFKAVVCTHPLLMATADRVPADLRLCDDPDAIHADILLHGLFFSPPTPKPKLSLAA